MNTSTDCNDIQKLVRTSRQNGGVLRWPLPPELETAVEVTYRNAFAENLSHKSAPDIVRSYVYLSQADMACMMRLAERHVLPRPLHGVGIELGAGCGLLASVVAQNAAIEAVFALEVCEQMARLNIPKVAQHVLGEYSRKVIPVIGSFDDLRLPDNSLDFAIEIDSLHHSHDLKRTLTECARVLKPDGVALCFDRCHPDSLPDEEVEAMLSKVYSRAFLIANSYPSDAVLTRRENGEHEYRRFEWQAAFDAAGLQLLKTCQFHRQVSPRAAVKGALSVLPKRVQRRLHRSEHASFKTPLSWLAQQTWQCALYGSSKSRF